MGIILKLDQFKLTFHGKEVNGITESEKGYFVSIIAEVLSFQGCMIENQLGIIYQVGIHGEVDFDLGPSVS